MPNPDQGQQNGQVLIKLGRAEMTIHGLGAAQECVEIIRSNRDHQRQANRPPHRISPTDPIGKAKDAGSIDAKGGGFFGRGGQSRELGCGGGHMPRHPCACCFRIGHSFNCGKCFGCHDHKRGFWVQIAQRIGDMCAIDI